MPTSPAEVARAIEMAEAGVSDAVIGAALGLSSRTVFRIRQRTNTPSSWKPTRAACGSPGRYKAGCRCTTCCAGNIERLRAAKAERYARREAGTAVFTHGASAYGNWGCRCTTCTSEHRAKMAARHRRTRRSTGGAR